MPIDREQTLKQAEKLLRQGRLEAAIAEYGRIVAEFPRDWATANLLGDLYVRAGDARQAAQQYARVADHLAADGFVAKAAALYKKILKLEPADEAALLRSADLAAAQGLVADLRAFLNTLFQQRLKRGDRDGARALAARRVSYDTADVVARLDAARMLAEAGDAPGAAAELRAAGLALEGQGRVPEATRALRESLRFDATHDETRRLLIRLLLAQGDPQGAVQAAVTAEHRRALIADLSGRSDTDVTRAVLEHLVEADPGDPGARAALARRYLAAGDLGRAETCLAAGADAGDFALGLTLAELDLRQGRLDEGAARVSELLARRWEDAPEAAALAERLTTVDADAGAAVMAAVTASAAARREFAWARQQLGRFLAKAPGSVTTWRGLIDLCVDAGFDADLERAQAGLADALVGREQWQEAMAVAEDLASSFPGNPGHLERLRRTLVGLGLDPGTALPRLGREPAVADRTSDHDPEATGIPTSPVGDGLLSDDLSDLVSVLSSQQAPAPPDAFDLSAFVPPLPPHDEPAGGPGIAADAFHGALPTRPVGSALFDDELRRLFEEEPGRAANPAGDLVFEVDLSRALEDLRAADEPRIPDAAVEVDFARSAEPDRGAPDDLEDFFRKLRNETVVDPWAADAQRLFDEGQASHAEGQADRAIAQLRAAAREPSLRLRAARLIAKISKEEGRLNEAIEWLERAAEVPAPSLDTWQDLLAELADTLEQAGERARALAVLLELRAVTPGYRDVDERIAALSEESRARPDETPGRSS